MKSNAYSKLPKSAFWKTGVTQANPYALEGIHTKKFNISASTKIATAGSCFAQHISYHLKNNGYNVLDFEPPPPALPESLHNKFGFSMYSARYGNIYSVRQLLQLSQEAAGELTPNDYVWERDGKYFDALRPAVEPYGLDSPQDIIELRKYHIIKVKELFECLDLFIFTFGLTEMWVHNEFGTVYPTAPGTLAGQYDENIYTFKNAQFNDIITDFNKFQEVLKRIRGGKPFNVLLTISPVPLTASASGKHVLVSTTYSKSTLRCAAGQLSMNQHHIDYFPSYEIVTNPRIQPVSFTDNLRTVRKEAVENVMKHFFSVYEPLKMTSQKQFVTSEAEPIIGSLMIQCEDALLEAFGENN